MTNAERYLKDEMLLKDFISDYMNYCERNKQDSVNLESLSLFLRTEAKPVLTEDERVILHYVDNRYTHIQRDCGLWIVNYEDEFEKEMLSFEMYSHLFQFIKERRRIFY